MIYKIINNKNFTLNEISDSQKKQLLDFFFKCLEKYGKNASILFIKLDFGFAENIYFDLITKLNDNYSDIFDFNMLN